MAFQTLLLLIASMLLLSTKGIETVTTPLLKPPTTLAPIRIETPTPAPDLTPPKIVTPRPLIKSKAECGPQCDDRCSLHSRPNVCLRACNTCCVRCLCVPPGTSGNKEVCKCYANMTTTGGKSKCP